MVLDGTSDEARLSVRSSHLHPELPTLRGRHERRCVADVAPRRRYLQKSSGLEGAAAEKVIQALKAHGVVDANDIVDLEALRSSEAVLARPWEMVGTVGGSLTRRIGLQSCLSFGSVGLGWVDARRVQLEEVRLEPGRDRAGRSLPWLGRVD